MKTSRRRFAQVLGGSAAAAVLPAGAQQKPAPATAARPATQESSENELRKFPLPMATEPAFIFRAVEE